MTAQQPRRILLIRNAYNYDFGGGERFPVNLANELQSNGYLPIVVSRSPKLLAYTEGQHVRHIRGWWWSQQKWTGQNVLLFPVYLVWQILLFGWYLQLLLRLKHDVVHPQSKDDFIAATFAAKLLGKKVVWTDHADLKYIFANHTIWYKNPVGKLVYLASKLTNTITLVSDSEKELIQGVLGHTIGKRFVVVHNGVTDTLVTPISDLSHEQFVFCATSRLVAAKGITELIYAFQTLHKSHPESALWLVGDGPDEHTFRDQATGDSSINFIGHSDESLSYVAACDVFVHPSYHEGFSLSLVEAAMLTKPIVACDVGGNPEIIEHGVNGLLVPAHDSAALADAMIKLMNDQTMRQRIGKAAREKYVSNFEFSQIVKERFIPIYEN